MSDDDRPKWFSRTEPILPRQPMKPVIVRIDGMTGKVLSVGPKLGRPTGPTPGSDAERWYSRALVKGERAARDEFYAAEKQKPRTARRGYRWWKDSILYHLEKRGKNS